MRGFLGILIFACGPVLLANPTDELLRLVPKEATVCFIAQDLRGHAARVSHSPFAEWAQQSPWGKNVAASNDFQRLLAAQKKIAETLGVKVETLRDGLFGDAAVYAYLPGPAGKPEDDAGLLLTQVRDAELLAQTAAKLNDAQKHSGEVLKIIERTHSGAIYFVREKPGSRADYYFIHGGLLMYSSRESPLQLALERRANAEPLAKAVPYFAQAHKQLGFEKAVFAGVFAPRSIDAELKSVAGILPNEDAKAFVQQFAKFWATVDAVGLALELDSGVEISLGWVSKANATETAALASALWAAVPGDAMLAVVGRVRWNDMLSAARTLMGEASRVKFQQWLDQTVGPIVGRDVLPKLLEKIGPDLGGWITAPHDDAKSHFPTVALAVRVPTADSADAKLRDALRQGIDFIVQAYRVDYNRKHDDQFSSDTERVNDTRITVIENDKALPAGVCPAYGLREQFFVIGSHPGVVTDFPAKPQADPKHAGLIVRFSATRTAKYLQQHGKPLAAALAANSGKDASQMEKEFAELAKLLALFDTWELRHTVNGELGKFTWKIEFSKPLK